MDDEQTNDNHDKELIFKLTA